MTAGRRGIPPWILEIYMAGPCPPKAGKRTKCGAPSSSGTGGLSRGVQPARRAKPLVTRRTSSRSGPALGGWRLPGCMYVMLEPCPMCAGPSSTRASMKVMARTTPSRRWLLYNLAEGRLNHTPAVTGGVLAEEFGPAEVVFSGAGVFNGAAAPHLTGLTLRIIPITCLAVSRMPKRFI